MSVSRDSIILFYAGSDSPETIARYISLRFGVKITLSNNLLYGPNGALLGGFFKPSGGTQYFFVFEYVTCLAYAAREAGYPPLSAEQIAGLQMAIIE